MKSCSTAGRATRVPRKNQIRPAWVARTFTTGHFDQSRRSAFLSQPKLRGLAPGAGAVAFAAARPAAVTRGALRPPAPWTRLLSRATRRPGAGGRGSSREPALSLSTGTCFVASGFGRCPSVAASLPTCGSRRRRAWGSCSSTQASSDWRTTSWRLRPSLAASTLIRRFSLSGILTDRKVVAFIGLC